DLHGDVGPDHPYGRQGDLSHLSKVYAELCLQVYGVDVRLLRLGIVYGPSPVEHEEKTVVDKFRELAARGEALPLDDGGRAATGATGFLGWRATVLLRERGHDVLALARPGGAQRAHARDLDVARVDAGDPAVREVVAGRDAVLHFAGVPDPAGARRDPAGAVRANAGTTLNLLESGAPLVYPSSARAGLQPPPDPYAMSKRLGEEACRLHGGRATVVRLPSVFGPGQVRWEG